MTMFPETPKAQQMDVFFSELDARGETAAPGELDVDEDTSGPEDDDDSQETAAAELDAEDGDTGDLQALATRGKRTLTLDEARALQARARARGKRVGQVQERKKLRRLPMPRPQLPKNMVPPGDGFRTLVQRWAAKNEPFVINQAGSYYYATEIRCKCEGSPERAWLRIPRGEYLFFDKAIEDECSYLGNPGKVGVDITNFQRPSKNSYHGQEFLIQSISMMEANLRVRYEDSDISAANMEGAGDVLRGNSWLWDDAGVFLPSQIFHDVTGENLLYRAVRRSGALYFRWQKARVGGSATQRHVLVDHLRNVPDVRVRSLARTSGGAPVLHVPDGYVFCDDPERSEDGAFTATLTLTSDVIFPIKPIDLGAGKPARPMEVGLYVQLNLNGIGFQLDRRNRPQRG